MKDPIFLRRPNGPLVRMERAPYDTEDLLQSLLANHPDLLAGERMETSEPRRWLLVSREAGVPAELGGGNRWSLDHLFLDQDAVPTLVEVKRSSDTRIRREVVGQMLDYAANAAEYWDVQTVQALFEETCEARATTSEAALQELLGESGDPNAYWSELQKNLETGRMRLLFVADEIPRELQRIIEYLNGQMDRTVVLGVEIPQFVCGDLQTLVPRVVGLTMQAQVRKETGGARRRITREALIGAFPDTSREAVSSFLGLCDRQGLEIYLGDTGCSVRMKLPDGSKSTSVAWIFPPGTIGWMGLTGISGGCERSLLSPETSFSTAFHDYFEALSQLPGVREQERGYVAAFEVNSQTATESLPVVGEHISALQERLREIEKLRQR